MKHYPTELLLDRLGVAWEHDPTLALSDVDLTASIANQVRLEPIDRPTVDRYVAALTDGAEFPDVIIRRQPKRLVTVGGNHRIQSRLEAGLDTVGAYIIAADDLTVLEIACADNAAHGLPPTDHERTSHALVLITGGRTPVEAARAVGIDVQRVYFAQGATKVAERTARLGLARTLAKVPRSAHWRLASIENDKVFAAVLVAMAERQITSSGLGRVVADLNLQKTPKAALELLALHIERTTAIGPQRRRNATADPYLALRTALGTVRGLNPSDIVEAAAQGITRAELARLCLDGARHLKVIHDLAERENPAIAS